MRLSWGDEAVDLEAVPEHGCRPAPIRASGADLDVSRRRSPWAGRRPTVNAPSGAATADDRRGSSSGPWTGLSATVASQLFRANLTSDHAHAVAGFKAGPLGNGCRGHPSASSPRYVLRRRRATTETATRTSAVVACDLTSSRWRWNWCSARRDAALHLGALPLGRTATAMPPTCSWGPLPARVAADATNRAARCPPEAAIGPRRNWNCTCEQRTRWRAGPTSAPLVPNDPSGSPGLAAVEPGDGATTAPSLPMPRQRPTTASRVPRGQRRPRRGRLRWCVHRPHVGRANARACHPQGGPTSTAPWVRRPLLVTSRSRYSACGDCRWAPRLTHIDDAGDRRPAHHSVPWDQTAVTTPPLVGSPALCVVDRPAGECARRDRLAAPRRRRHARHAQRPHHRRLGRRQRSVPRAVDEYVRAIDGTGRLPPRWPRHQAGTVTLDPAYGTGGIRGAPHVAEPVSLGQQCRGGLLPEVSESGLHRGRHDRRRLAGNRL